MTGFVLMPVLLVLLGAPGHDLLTIDDLNTTKPEVQKHIVKLHNDFRLKEPASNMLLVRWSDEAAEMAAKWAEKCTLEHSAPEARTLSNGVVCGENIFQATHSEIWDAAANSWNAEKKDYDVHSIDWGKVGHYTQMVWNRSNQLGCAVSHCPGTKTPYFYVCNYCPAGNYVGKTPFKEGEHCGDCPNDCINGLCDNACIYADKANNCHQMRHRWYCLFPGILYYCQAYCKCGDKIC